MKIALVRNKPGTSDETPPKGYDSWKEYWMDKQGVTDFGNCSVLDCKSKAEHGSHVEKVRNTEHGIVETHNVYITPLCAEHNNYRNREQFKVREKQLVLLRSTNKLYSSENPGFMTIL